MAMLPASTRELWPCLDRAIILARIFFLKKESRMHGVLNEVCETSLGMSVTFRNESNDNN